ncbi:dephospho-CoA kinase [Maricurvus nonylphenolicus]|uniref:dephospho-CoA kinase n=1 Tax=Maricurvus nonylphenolicus TaxID=1008307 RepID=UPI0036F23C2B
MTLIIGLTGGIGSGKTAVSDRFAAKGITVVDADLASRAVVEPGRPALQAIEEHFGSEVITPEGSLDRALLRQKVFADENERKWLEQLTHPLIREEIISGLENATSPYALLVSPLLVESGQSQLTQRILVVDVPEAVQLERTMARDDNPEAQVKAIMAAQANRETRLGYADDVVENNGSLEDLDRQVEQLHQRYLTLAEG